MFSKLSEIRFKTGDREESKRDLEESVKANSRNYEAWWKLGALYRQEKRFNDAIECFKKALLPLDEIKAFFTYEKDMVANYENILDMMKAQEEKTLERMKDLETGLTHLQKKIRYYSLVNEAIKNDSPLPSWNDL